MAKVTYVKTLNVEIDVEVKNKQGETCNWTTTAEFTYEGKDGYPAIKDQIDKDVQDFIKSSFGVMPGYYEYKIKDSYAFMDDGKTD